MPLSRKESLRWIAYAAGAAALLAWVPWLGLLAYPFRLLATLVHELGHGLAALATGGEFLRFVVFADGSGLATTAGGWRLIVIPAGYLGAAAFAALLVMVGRSPRASRWALGLTGAGIGLLTLRYATPGLVAEGVLSRQALGAGIALVSGLALGACLVWLAAEGTDRSIVFGLHLVAIQVGLTSLSDLWTLVGLSSLARVAENDARAMAEIAFLPAMFWALSWAAAAGLLLAVAVRRTWFPRRRRG